MYEHACVETATFRDVRDRFDETAREGGRQGWHVTIVPCAAGGAAERLTVADFAELVLDEYLTRKGVPEPSPRPR